MPGANYNPSFGDELAEIKRRLRALETGSRLGNASISSGALSVRNADSVEIVKLGDLSTSALGGLGASQGLSLHGGSAFILVDPTDNQPTAYLGSLSGAYTRPDGKAQVTTLLYRDTGELAFSIADFDTADGYQQYIGLFDRAGNTIVSDDTNSGTGLARPHIPVGQWTDNLTPTATTTSASFVNLQVLIGEWQHPRVALQAIYQSSSAGTTGEVRCVDSDGIQIGTTQTVNSLDFAFSTFGTPAVLPGDFGAAKVLYLQARRTGGTGTIGVRGVQALGTQS
jgi:hypothetical protein